MTGAGDMCAEVLLMWHVAGSAGLTTKLRQLRWAPRACALTLVAPGSVLSPCGVCVSMLGQMAGASDMHVEVPLMWHVAGSAGLTTKLRQLRWAPGHVRPGQWPQEVC